MALKIQYDLSNSWNPATYRVRASIRREIRYSKLNTFKGDSKLVVSNKKERRLDISPHS